LQAADCGSGHKSAEQIVGRQYLDCAGEGGKETASGARRHAGWGYTGAFLNEKDRVYVKGNIEARSCNHCCRGKQ